MTAGADTDFKKPTPLHKIEKPPFYAAWATPILHDTLTGLRTNTNSEVIDIRGEVIAGLYCAGESQGGFAQHGLTRCIVFGRLAGRHAARRKVAEASGTRLMTAPAAAALVHLEVSEPVPAEARGRQRRRRCGCGRRARPAATGPAWRCRSSRPTER